MAGSRRAFLVLLSLAGVFAFSGCLGRGRRGAGALVPEVDLGVTIGSLTQVMNPERIGVEGYGLVGGLDGTGSAECPTGVRRYLTRYIMKQLPRERVDFDKLLDSPTTAVVRIDGTAPGLACRGESFDLRVTALDGTQTTSLEGGWLYSSELWPSGGFGAARPLPASAAGPVFIDPLVEPRADKRVGYVLGGGGVLESVTVGLVLLKPDYRTASLIRNGLNMRFGEGTARAVLAGRIDLTVPARYKGHEWKFVSMVGATYLGETAELLERRIMHHVRELAVSEDKYGNELALESIGRASLGKLGILLSSSREDVRFHAGRCMLNLGSEMGFEALRAILLDAKSVRRVQALAAIGSGARRENSAGLLRGLLSDDDFSVRVTAYEQLRRLGDVSVSQEFLGRSVYLEQLGVSGRKAIYVTRSGEPRIVLFGGPIYCRPNLFVESADAMVTINAPSGGDYVTIIRRDRGGRSVQARASFLLADVLRKLCEEPARAGDTSGGGIGGFVR